MTRILDSEAERMIQLAANFERLAKIPTNTPGERDRLLHLAAQHKEAAKAAESEAA